MMMSEQTRFVLRTIDPQTDCVAFEAAFEVADLDELCAQLGLEPEDFDPSDQYDLDRSAVDRIRAHFQVDFEPGEFPVVMRPWVPFDALPYPIHTNRELAMMLAGTKPLAVFVSEYPADGGDETPAERLFEKYALSGRFLKQEHIYSQTGLSGQEQKFRRVLYAQPDQQWRIPAYLLLWKTAEKSGWSEGFERMEGSLLGYEDWQNDAYIELIWGQAGGEEDGSGSQE